jgi:hypothetical protein
MQKKANLTPILTLFTIVPRVEETGSLEMVPKTTMGVREKSCIITDFYSRSDADEIEERITPCPDKM